MLGPLKRAEDREWYPRTAGKPLPAADAESGWHRGRPPLVPRGREVFCFRAAEGRGVVDTTEREGLEAAGFPTAAAVIGLGLIGGSLALALRAAGARVAGVDTDGTAVEAAMRRGAIGNGGTDLAAVAEADLVVLATPLARIVEAGTAAARLMRRGAVLTDVGSVKGPIVEALEEALPEGILYVGGHPMAGSEGQGIGAADAALLAGRPFVLTPTQRTSRTALTLMEVAVRRIGMRPVLLDPRSHDEFAAQVSHLPYLVSVALLRAASAEALSVSGPAMSGMTRVARSPSAMWVEICRSNRGAILAALDRFEGELARLRRGIQEGDPEGVISNDRDARQ